MPFWHGLGLHVPSDLPSTSVGPDPGRSGCTTAEAHELHGFTRQMANVVFEKKRGNRWISGEAQCFLPWFCPKFFPLALGLGRIQIKETVLKMFFLQGGCEGARCAAFPQQTRSTWFQTCRIMQTQNWPRLEVIDLRWSEMIWDDLRNNTNFQMFLSVAAEGCGVELNSAQPPPVKRT